MFIVLDPSEGGMLYLLRSGTWHSFSCSAARAPALLAAIVKILSANDLRLEQVRGFGILVGKGTFTGTRVAVTLANTLAFAHGVAVAALKNLPEPSSLDSAFSAGQGTPYIAAIYSGEPRIHGAAKKS